MKRFLPASVAIGCVVLALAPIACSRPTAGHYATLDGLRMYYEVRGRGPVLALLHGGAGNGSQFANQITAFEKTHRLVIPDLCAQGRTSDRPGPLTYHAMAEDVIALMNRLRVKQFDVMGWSDGGIIGLDLAMRHPERIRHLVTFGANFTPDGVEAADAAWNDTATAAAFGDGMREGWQKLAPDPRDYEVAMNKIIQLWKTQPNYTLAELHTIRAKTLVCAGEHDLVRPEHTAQLAQAIPGSELWIVPGATHGAMLEKPREVNPRVLEFLER